MLQTVEANEIPWITESAKRFKNWLLRNGSPIWTKESLALPGIYRWTVSSICYEGSWENLWSEPWFQEGMRAFGLLALEGEGQIKILKSRKGDLSIRCPDGRYSIAAFLNGESLSFRHDPEYSDLSWDPVGSIYHVLSEYRED